MGSSIIKALSYNNSFKKQGLSLDQIASDAFEALPNACLGNMKMIMV